MGHNMTKATYDRYYRHYIVISFKSSSVHFSIYDDRCFLSCFGSGEREQGHGTEVLNACRRLARRLSKPLHLTANPYRFNGEEPYSLERLIAYYEKRGFKKTGRGDKYDQQMEYVP